MVSVCLPSDALLQHLKSYLGFFYLVHGVSLHGCSSKAQLLLLTLGEGYLLTTALPDLQRGIAPLGPPAPLEPPLLGCGVARAGNRRWSLQLPGEDRCTQLLSLPMLLGRQPATQKRGVGVGVWDIFQGHQLVPAGRPHPTHTPPGHQAPLSREHHPGGLPWCSFKLLLPSAAAATAGGGGGKTLWAVLGLEHPHTAASPGIHIYIGFPSSLIYI